MFKKWTMVEGTRSDQSGSPIIAFTWNRPLEEDNTVYKYSTEEQSMQFRGTVEKQPLKILLDTGASGTAFIDMQFCKDVNITLYPAPSNIHIVFDNSSKVQATNMAVVTVRMGHYKCKVERLVVDH
jgi:predicted aspartyl protease